MQAAQSVLDAESGSAVDSTLEEIQKLRIIDNELARASGEDTPAQPDRINEQAIESTTLQQLGDRKDRPTVESLVQQQIQDQADRIDSANALTENFDTLEYGANIDNKAFLQEEDKSESVFDAPTPQPKPVKKAPEPEVDPAISQSQAALDAVAIKTPGAPQPGTKGAPLMPSADASKSTLDATFSYAPKPRADVYKKPKKSLSPAQERKLVDNLIEKSVQAGKERAKAHPPPQPFVEPPKEDKNTAALALITAKHSVAEKEAPPHKDLAEVESSVKEHAEVKHAHRHHKKHRHHRHHKPMGNMHVELVQTKQKSAAQLENLFLSVRDDLLTKPAKPHQATLLQLDNKSKLRQRDSDLSLDEEADLMLKGKARQITEEGKFGHPTTTKSTTHTEEQN